MKMLGYGLMLAGFVWAAVRLNAESGLSRAQGPIALLIGAGFGLLTTNAVRSGSVRGAQARIQREERPTLFWLIIGIQGAASLLMVWFGLGISWPG